MALGVKTSLSPDTASIHSSPQVAVASAKSALTALPKLPKQDIIFMDPPYHKNLGVLGLEIVEKCAILKNSGLLILEHDWDEQIPDEVGKLICCDSRKYGRCMLRFYRWKQEEAE